MRAMLSFADGVAWPWMQTGGSGQTGLTAAQDCPVTKKSHNIRLCVGCMNAVVRKVHGYVSNLRT